MDHTQHQHTQHQPAHRANGSTHQAHDKHAGHERKTVAGYSSAKPKLPEKNGHQQCK